MTPKDVKSNRNSFGGTKKDTRTDSAECRFPTAQVNGLPVPKNAAGWDLTVPKLHKPNASLSHSSVTGTLLLLKQHQVSTKTFLCFWNHMQSIIWNVSLNSKAN